MRTSRVATVRDLVILALVCSAVSIRSQERAQPAHEPQLALSLAVTHRRLHGLPRTITVRLRNVTGRDILVPQPHKECTDAMYGSLFFRVEVLPARGPKRGKGCVADYSFVGLSIQRRIQTWNRLAPGHSIDFTEDVAAEADALLTGSQTAGKYHFSASYEPPYISAEDNELLRAAKINFPEDPLETPTLTYDR